MDEKPLNATQDLIEGASGSPALNPWARRNFPTEFRYNQLTDLNGSSPETSGNLLGLPSSYPLVLKSLVVG